MMVLDNLPDSLTLLERRKIKRLVMQSLGDASEHANNARKLIVGGTIAEYSKLLKLAEALQYSSELKLLADVAASRIQQGFSADSRADIVDDEDDGFTFRASENGKFALSELASLVNKPEQAEIQPSDTGYERYSKDQLIAAIHWISQSEYGHISTKEEAIAALNAEHNLDARGASKAISWAVEQSKKKTETQLQRFERENKGKYGNGFHLVKETDRAIGIVGYTAFGDKTIWLPKSQVIHEYDKEDPEIVYIAMPQWLARRNDDVQNIYLFIG